MIPFAILSGRIDQKGQESQEIRILDLSEEGFTFRLAQKLPEKNAESDAGEDACVLHFFLFRESRYQKVILSGYQLEIEDEREYDVHYRLTTEDAEYQRYARQLMQDYMRYIALKLAGDDAQMSKELTGYPAEQEEQYAESFEKQRAEWFSGEKWDETHIWEGVSPKQYELGLSLDRPFWYGRYLELPLREFVKEYWKQNQLTDHPLTEKKADYLYIGNQFCHLLFPDEDVLDLLLEKAVREQVRPVLVFTYMQERNREKTEKILDSVAGWCGRRQITLELVVNDWGMLSLIRKKGCRCFTLTLGVLLQKRRKDVRMKYKQGFETNQDQLEESSLTAPFYQQYLREHFQIERISYEACGYPVKIAPMKASLHLPFYQMNTSQHCTLYARCHNGSRGRQSPVDRCPGYCEKQVFLYGRALPMVGRYNSLFGYEETILTDGANVQSYLNQGVDRIVAGFL